MNSRIIVSLLALVGALQAASPPELTVLRQQYEKATAERVTAPFESALTELNTKFTGALDKATAEAQKAGALPAVLAIEEDKKRIAGRLPLPDEDEEQTPDALKKLRVIYREQFKKLDDQRAANQSAILPAYVAKLEALEVTLTKAARVDEAKEVLEYRGSLASSDAASSETPATANAAATAGTGKFVKHPPRQVAEWVLSLGGDMGVREDNRTINVTKLEELPKGKFSIVRIRLTSKAAGRQALTDEAVNANLGALPDLETFVLFYPPLTEGGLEFLRACPKLKFLESDGCPLTDAVIDIIATRKGMDRFTIANDAEFHGTGIEALKSLPIGSMNFKNTAITDAALTSLKKFKSLKELILGETKISDEALNSFKKARPDVNVRK